jgi:hypothetical protein
MLLAALSVWNSPTPVGKLDWQQNSQGKRCWKNSVMRTSPDNIKVIGRTKMVMLGFEACM